MDQGLNQFLIKKFGDFLSEERKQFIETALQNRTEYIRVVLEDIADPHNTNAIIRTGEGLGIQHYHVIEKQNAFKIGRGVSRGATKWVDIHQHENSENPAALVLGGLKQKGYKIVVTSPDRNATPLQKLKINQPIALVLGNEQEGVSPEASQMADESIHIPMYGFTESFNVSVAAAVCLFNLIDMIRENNINWQFDEQQQTKYRLGWYKKCMARPDDYEEFFVKAYQSTQFQ